jgi:glutathione S-transferase
MRHRRGWNVALIAIKTGKGFHARDVSGGAGNVADITFHSMADSAYLWTAMLAADEKGVSYNVTELVYRSPEHLKLHPFGKMPVMQHGEIFIYESLAITHYIDRAFAGPALQPLDALGQADMLRWISIVNAYVFPS